MSKKVIFPKIVERITRNYPAIVRQCIANTPPSRGDLTIFDIVHDTVLKIIYDPHAETITSDEEFVKYFVYRSNTVIYKEVHDKKQLHKAYADYHKAQEN